MASLEEEVAAFLAVNGPLPLNPSKNGEAHKDDGEPPLEARRVATIADLKAEGARVKWLWGEGQCGWLADHVVCALASDPGLGKTRFCADLVRRIKFGLPWPDESPMTMPPESLAMWIMADNHHDQMVGICEAWDIEDRVVLNAWSHKPFEGTSLDNARDLKELEQRVEAAKPRLVIIDTVGNSTDKNLSKAEDAMAYYKPLQEMARRRQCLIFALTHLSASGKLYGRRGKEKVRVLMHLEKPDPNDDRLVLFVDKTGWKKPKPLGVKLTDTGYEYDTTPPVAPEPSEPGQGGYSGGQQAKKGPGRPSGKAKTWLEGRLKGGKAEWAKTLIDAAGEKGIEPDDLFRLKRAGVVEQYEEDGKKMWSLPNPFGDIPD